MFGSVIGALDLYDQGKIAGLSVEFGKKGIYYDAERGDNWWNYYFEPIQLGNPGVKKINIAKRMSCEVACRACQLREKNNISFQRARTLIDKYIHIKPEISSDIERFIQLHFRGRFVIGVHYRGTDKITEAPKVAFECVAAHIETVMKKRPGAFIFVATDDQHFLRYIMKRFPGQVLFQEAARSLDQCAVHNKKLVSSYRCGLEALTDCLLLSRCQLLIRTASNLSAASSMFQPHLPVMKLSTEYFDRGIGLVQPTKAF